MRDIGDAAAEGNKDAQLALEMLADSARRWASSFLFDLGGIDARWSSPRESGENRDDLRAAICRDLEGFGAELDPEKNSACRGKEAVISTDASQVKILVIPANEELVLAREVARKIS